MIDLDEKLIALADVPRELPARMSGRRIHVSTIHRWCSKGIKGLRLETLRIGGTAFTSREALLRFFRAFSQSQAADRRIDRIATIDADANALEKLWR